MSEVESPGTRDSMEPLPVVVSWSTGKDSAYALHVVRKDPRFRVTGLLTSVTEPFDRVSIHGVRSTLLDAQADALGLPLTRVGLPFPCPNSEYERRMAEACRRLHRNGTRGVVFGDLFLADVRAYRESRMADSGLQPVFPLWGRNTRALAREMIDVGMRARLVCVDPAKLSPDLAGREYDRALLEELPPAADPCGENGEFHTFAYASPDFTRPIEVRSGPSVVRDGFVFADLEPVRSR
ncbi:MAG TPA: ATP-binding protein [Thermoplasmata archaeon]|nr:ATP-binding protein [Thermoplasmata archaeon]